jgi:hypothetical protein
MLIRNQTNKKGNDLFQINVTRPDYHENAGNHASENISSIDLDEEFFRHQHKYRKNI